MSGTDYDKKKRSQRSQLLTYIIIFESAEN